MYTFLPNNREKRNKFEKFNLVGTHSIYLTDEIIMY